MSYEETIEYLFQAAPAFEHVGASAYKPGLQTTEALDEHYGHPHRQYKTIHIAGTNGKGSCSHTLASILQEAGHRVGLYTSPHLKDFRERIRVNGAPVEKEFVVDFVEDFRRWNQATEAPLHPSFFELTTAMAFKYFADQQVDIAVIEVGLGGRLDCTNIINPQLTIITNISLDHTQFLGTTLPEIAAEKAGIIKPGIPVVIGEALPETLPVFEEKARQSNAILHLAETFASPLEEKIEFELKGNYQQKNKRTILCAASILQLPEEAIVRGMRRVCENTGLMGRWQTLGTHPLVVCDTGHNLGGWEYLARQITAQPCRQLRIVFGMVDDKDLEGVMRLLPPHATYYFTQADNHRAVPAERIQTAGRKFGLCGNAYPTVCQAYHAALSDACPDDFVFVGGSSYVVADLLTSIA